MDECSLLSRVLDATERNSGLSGAELRSAAEAVADRATGIGSAVIASDEAGERIIGAALMTASLNMVDRSRRVDGQVILVVSGRVAGGFDIAVLAERMRSLGAAEVHAVVLGGVAEAVGCDSVTTLRGPTRAALVA